MNKTTKRFLVTSLSAWALACGAIGVANAPESKLATAETATTAISLVNGAACRIRTENDSEKGSGIRFKATLDQTQWTALAESNEMTAGILILPTDYIIAANGYTHSVLDAANKNYLDFTYTEEEIGNKTSISASMVDILDHNYTRYFSGVAYLKSTTVFEGATEYDGAYYAYAEYNEEDNSRSIYQIAMKAYNDRVDSKVTTHYEYSVTYNEKTSYSPYTDDQREVLKDYLDGVVDIQKDESKDVFITNNTEYYTSPYTIAKKADTEFIVNYDFSVTAKGMLYNGKRIKSLSVEEDETSISLTTDCIAYSDNVTRNYDGSVTIEGIRPVHAGYGSGVGSSSGGTASNYIAFVGEYGVGTYIDVEFTGNNMPYVMFFADSIDGYIGGDGTRKGVIITNGMVTGGNGANVDTNIRTDRMQIWGPNRYRGNAIGEAQNYPNELLAAITDCEALTQNGLNSDGYKNVNFHYLVGTYSNGTNIGVQISLLNKDTGDILYNNKILTTLTENDVTAANIVLYASAKGLNQNTTFSYSAPRVLLNSSDATLNIDGSVTLKGVRPIHAGFGSGVGPTGKKDSYIAFEGNYGVGTYIDVEFTGNNMPYVMFFADSINGYLGSNKTTDKGMILTNGMVTYGNGANVETKIRTDRLQIWGPNRYKGNAIGEAQNYPEELLATITDCAALTQDGLNSDTYKNTKFRYTVGTYSNGTNVVVCISLYNATTDEELYNKDIITKLTESDCVAGNIVLFASFKGLDQDTTFFYSEPYTKD